VPARVLPDPTLLERARAALPGARVVSIGTTARVGGTAGCPVEAMEGFAVLRACGLAGVPALEVRALANEIDEPDRRRWRLDDAIEVLRGAVPVLLEALDE
jgi:nucleoside phosphorylase